MSIEIKRVKDLYMANVTPPHLDGPPWETPKPMERRELIKKLFSLGCHQTDIGDALDAADRKIMNAE